jgi:hypothetical protein
MSIQLATPWAVSGPGIITESDAFAAVLAAAADWDAQTLIFTIKYGNATVTGSQTTSFVKGVQAPIINLVFNLGSDSGYTWQASNGLNGTLTPTDLAGLAAIMGATATIVQGRNWAELFVIYNNILGTGLTQYTW